MTCLFSRPPVVRRTARASPLGRVRLGFDTKEIKQVTAEHVFADKHLECREESGISPRRDEPLSAAQPRNPLATCDRA